jgi:hypothetical protein
MKSCAVFTCLRGLLLRLAVPAADIAVPLVLSELQPVPASLSFTLLAQQNVYVQLLTSSWRCDE